MDAMLSAVSISNVWEELHPFASRMLKVQVPIAKFEIEVAVLPVDQNIKYGGVPPEIVAVAEQLEISSTGVRVKSTSKTSG